MLFKGFNLVSSFSQQWGDQRGVSKEVMSDLVFRPGRQGRCVPGRRHSLCEGLVTQSLQLRKPEVVGCNQNGEWVLQEVGG